MALARHHWFGLLALSLCAAAPSASAGEYRTVLELFTSQSCALCPPADRLVAKWAEKPGVLTLSFHVDYWNFGGWTDTFSSPLNTQRQRDYVAARQLSDIYTPEVVVNGALTVAGGDAEAIEEAARETPLQKGVLATALSVAEADGKLTVAIGAAAPGGPRQAGVYAVALTRASAVSVRRGENAGATLTYRNVVRAFTKIGDWRGEAMTLQADAASARAEGADAYAIVLQAGEPDRPALILAAAGP